MSLCLPPRPTPSLALLGVCYRRSMHLAKSIRVFRASALYRYSLPLFPSISSSLSHFSLTLRGLLITSLISLSGFLWGAIWPRWYVHEGVRLCVITGMCVCSHVHVCSCLARLSRQMLHLTLQHSCSYRGGVVDNSTSKLNKCVHFLTA